MNGNVLIAPRSSRKLEKSGSIHPADDHEIPALVLVEGAEHLADLAPIDPSMRKALDLVPGLAADANDMQR